jgi:hypothetical protein
MSARLCDDAIDEYIDDAVHIIFETHPDLFELLLVVVFRSSLCPYLTQPLFSSSRQLWPSAPAVDPSPSFLSPCPLESLPLTTYLTTLRPSAGLPLLLAVGTSQASAEKPRIPRALSPVEGRAATPLGQHGRPEPLSAAPDWAGDLHQKTPVKTDHETLGRFGKCRHVLYGNSNNAEGTPPTESLLPWYYCHGIKYVKRMKHRREREEQQLAVSDRHRLGGR